MTPPLFIVVTDAHFFPGALVAVASILAYHSTARIVVVESGILGKKLSGCQKSMLKALGAEVDETGVYGQGDRKQGAWELKAYAAERYADQAPVIVGIDADCTLCGPVDDILLQCERTGEFLGGKDGDGVVYDKSYEPYGFPVPARNDATCQLHCISARPRRSRRRSSLNGQIVVRSPSLAPMASFMDMETRGCSMRSFTSGAPTSQSGCWKTICGVSTGSIGSGRWRFVMDGSSI